MMKSEKEQIHQLSRDYANGFLEGNVDQLLKLFTEDFIAITPDKPPISGKMATRQCIIEDLKTMTISEIKFELQEIEAAGDWAYAWGLSSVLITRHHKDEPARMKGKFMWVLEKSAEGIWQIKRDCAFGDVN